MTSKVIPRGRRRIIIVGAGLFGCLAAYRLRRQGHVVTLIDRAVTLGGTHTWSFHGTDLPKSIQSTHPLGWLAPLVSRSWSHYDVKFPGYCRRIPLPYHTIESESLVKTIAGQPCGDFLTGAEVVTIADEGVELRDGNSLAADLVIDARGLDVHRLTGPVAYQKFLGLELRLQRPHGLSGCLVMDATIPQRDGFRFMYALPLSPSRLLVEETFYSTGPTLDNQAIVASILAWTQAQGLAPFTILREERGILPIPLLGSAPAPADLGVLRAGTGAGMFHPVTGYSLGDSVAFIERLAQALDYGHTGGETVAQLATAAEVNWRAAHFWRRLNSMLFCAGAPEERRRIFEHFYRLPVTSIARFYSRSMHLGDWSRLFRGGPPVPITGALRAFFASRPSQTLSRDAEESQHAT